MLEGHMLDDLPTELVKQLSVFIRSEQLEKSPTLRSGKLVTKAIEEFKDWLALQDIPEPIERKPSEMGIRFESTAADSAKLSPPSPMRKSETRAYDRHPDIPVRKPSNPRPVPQSSVDTVDMGVFVMDDGEVECRTNEQPIAPRDPSDSPKKTLSGWKISTAPK